MSFVKVILGFWMIISSLMMTISQCACAYVFEQHIDDVELTIYSY